MALKKLKSINQNEVFTELNNDLIQNNRVYSSEMEMILAQIEDNTNIPKMAQVEEGRYRFIIENVIFKKGINSKYRAVLISFSLSRDRIIKPIKVTIPYTYSTDKNSPFTKFIFKFKHVLIGTDPDINQLINKCGLCCISHNRDISGDIYDALVVLVVDDLK